MKKLLLVCVSLFFSAFASAAEKPKLNFVFILADDLGWTDLSCYGSKFYETPNLDKLASQGMKFTQAYSACTVCSPTRASFLTGKYPARLHVTDWITGHKRPNAKLVPPDWTMHLPGDETTIAQVLKSVGYATASIGKWHLGDEEFYPKRFGFDENIGGFNKGSPPSYFSPYKNPFLIDGPDGEYLTDRLAEETVGFIKRNKDKPFFIYLPHYAVHTPIQAKPEVIEKYRKKIKPGDAQNDPAYAALVESLDDSVGRIMSALDDLKLAERTVIIFTSDNGGLIPKTSNAPLRVGKGSAYEGGVRVPLIVRWPGAAKPGSQSDAPVMSIDFYPTLLEMAGVTDAPNHTSDGENLVPLLKQSGKPKRTTLFWHYPHYHPGGATPYGAIRDGDFKLIQFYETGGFELYNLKEDIGETNNLAKKMGAKIGELNKQLDLWRRNVGAQMPLPNPNYDPTKSDEYKK